MAISHEDSGAVKLENGKLATAVITLDAAGAVAAGGGGGGDASAANQATLNTLTGAVTETAPATDTASSGLNGRLQRVAQRLTSLIALLPASLGAKTSAASLAVVLASDQAALPVTGSFASAGDIAHDAADSGNPVKLGGKAVNALPAAVTNNDRVNAYFDLYGRLATFIAAALTPVDHGIRAYPVAPDGIVDAAGAVYTLKFASVTSTADGEFSIVALVTNKKIRVLSLSVTTLTTAGVFSLKSAAAGATIFQAHLLVGTPLAYATVAPNALCESAVSGALIGNNAAGVDSFVNVSYIEV